MLYLWLENSSWYSTINYWGESRGRRCGRPQPPLTLSLSHIQLIHSWGGSTRGSDLCERCSAKGLDWIPIQICLHSRVMSVHLVTARLWFSGPGVWTCRGGGGWTVQFHQRNPPPGMEWQKNKKNKTNYWPRLETTVGLTFIWPQKDWMVNCNIDGHQHTACGCGWRVDTFSLSVWADVSDGGTDCQTALQDFMVRQPM